MASIRILPEILANKIAAGEVVDRPASVVKELVENALDAGSSRILIDVHNGGRSQIQVSDNGHGMSPDDALMALERFATSKIRNDNDLFAIQTLGFRGEALPSIAAVSKMTLLTRDREGESGVEIQIQGGKIIHVKAAGAPAGTMIRVSQLFFNTPARRKFLKSIATEMSHIADAVAGMALGHPHVYFKLTHNDQLVKQWPRVSQPAGRIVDVLGQKSPEQLIMIDHVEGDLKLCGCIGAHLLTRSTSRNIYLYVNGRRVRDRMIQHALTEGYRGRLMKGQFPVAVLFLNLPFDQVDVNVHPTKHEVRFVNTQRVHTTVRDSIAAALRERDRNLWRISQSHEINSPNRVAQESAAYGPQVRSAESDHRSNTAPSRRAVASDAPDSKLPRTLLKSTPQNSHAVPEPKANRPIQQTIWRKGGFADLTVVGQFRGTYIICQDDDDLIIIDQHAAHERIVYERLAQGAGAVESQRLLIPETVELGFAETEALSRLLPQLNTMGLEIDYFGGTTFAIKSLPTLLAGRDATDLVRALAETTVENDAGSNLDKVLEACRMVMACHNAVRANQRLAPEQIDILLDQLDHCANPSQCPHGRPTWIRWTLKELEKSFKRIVP